MISPDAQALKARLEGWGFDVGSAETVPAMLDAFEAQLAALCGLVEQLSSLGYRRGLQPARPLDRPRRQVEPVLLVSEEEAPCP